LPSSHRHQDLHQDRRRVLRQDRLVKTFVESA